MIATQQRAYLGASRGGVFDSRSLPASSVGDFWTLLKPNVMQLVLFTSWVAYYLAPGRLNPILGVTAILCIAAGAGASAAINNWYDADIDCEMARTRRRPTATGRIAGADALAVGIVLAILSVMVMGLALNWLAAALLAFTIAFYVFVYTMWLKRSTPQNIVIGGAAGALPPLVAWAAVTGRIDLLPVIMFGIIFLWTPAHFWALALYRCADYAKVSVPMLPVVAGRKSTRRQIFIYALLLAGCSLVPWLAGDLGYFYLLASLALGAGIAGWAWLLLRRDSDRVAMKLFRFSIVYLFLLFGAMAGDRLVQQVGGWLYA